MTGNRSCVLALTLAILAIGAAAQEATPYPRISEEAFRARLPFFDINPSMPLEGRIVREWDGEETLRQKFVFRGAQGFIVPGYIELPKNAAKPCPLVLLLHGWSGNKEGWWEDGNIMSGGNMRKALLGAGYAVMALDAATHGERSNEIDYQHVNAFNDPNAPGKVNYFTFAEISIQTVKDYRRGLDYITQRDDIDANRIGLVGYSMGGMDAFFLVSVEPRIKAVVACVPPLINENYNPASPVDYSWGVCDTPFLMLMGSQDDMYDKTTMNATYHAYIKGPNTNIIWYDQGHKLTEVYVPDALAWIEQYLK
ncbi:MAG: hypothetical protein AMXMBFR82_26210 [Candidatus Hydrogenedentota bacterium]